MSVQTSDARLLALAAEHGTPLYVYNVDVISAQYKALTQAFQAAPAKFFYACKALTNLSILQHIAALGCNIDCSSINEAHLALRAGFSPQRILYTSNGIGFAEIQAAVALGLTVNIDSLSNLDKFGAAYGGTYPVGLRLRPNIMAGGNLKISTGHANSKFGIPIEQMDQVQALRQAHGLRIAGLHVHTGSEVKDLAVFMQVADIFAALLPQFPDLVYLDMGGGFKVPYKDEEVGTDMAALGKAVADFFAHLEKTQGKKLEAWFEPGKYLVSACGHFVTSVNVIKENPTATVVGINTGFNNLIRPMFYDAYHRIRNISHPQGTLQSYTVVGHICETDTFATDRPLAQVREGDVLVFDNAGAYGFEMGSHYNSRFLPAQVMVRGEDNFLIRKRDQLEDLLHNQILIAPKIS